MLQSETGRQEAAEAFVGWLAGQVEADGTGAPLTHIGHDPRGRFWLGRLAPEGEVVESDLGARAERLEPCAVGMRLAPDANAEEQIRFTVTASLCIWRQDSSSGAWTKSPAVTVSGVVEMKLVTGIRRYLTNEFREAILKVAPESALSAAVEVDVLLDRCGRPEVVTTLVNTSEVDGSSHRDYARGRLFECRLLIREFEHREFILESLPDSFRYDRRVPAWGINCGVRFEDGEFSTVDLPVQEKRRPEYWTVPDAKEDAFAFDRLAKDPIAPGRELLDDLRRWGAEAWDLERVRGRVPGWNDDIEAEVRSEKNGFEREARRIAKGLELLDTNERLNRAFRLMNEAMLISARDGYGGYKYTAWRPFQAGFLYANLESCLGEGVDVVDIVWFATGGGKTETYLGLILTAAFMDRFRGKVTGVTAWSRFPLRLLSLQQTQRFANALAAAEIVRKRNRVAGDPFGLGFLVGNSSTPNEIRRERDPKRRGQWDYDDPDMPDSLRMLKECPFCRSGSITMRFNRRNWILEHRCGADECPWGQEDALPIWIVDAEVWRFLPTVIVGTLDKAAGISMQANMRGLVGAPYGFCSKAGHGHTYATRANRPTGCLVPDCNAVPKELLMERSLYGVSFRLQDELHLLRDSLGAVDAHYEALYDQLQERMGSAKPKILASSATLSGYERQCDVLYGRDARVFPHPEPAIGEGFWTRDSERKMRTYLAVSPRGHTVEFATDRMMIALQSAVRRFRDDPGPIANEIGIDVSLKEFLVDLYGTNVVYGNTLRDLDAVVRSAETQWEEIPAPRPNAAVLTGRTTFAEVSETLEKTRTPTFGLCPASACCGRIVHDVARSRRRQAQRDGNAGLASYHGRVHSGHRASRTALAVVGVRRAQGGERAGRERVPEFPAVRRSRRSLRRADTDNGEKPTRARAYHAWLGVRPHTAPARAACRKERREGPRTAGLFANISGV